MADYKPTENDGLRKDGQPDQRMNKEFADGKVDPVEAGKKGGQTQDSQSGGGTTGSNPGEAHLGGEGLRKDGQPDQRLKQNQ